MLVASDVMLLSAGGFNLAVFCSSVLWERSTLRAGEAKLLEPFRGVEGVSLTGSLFGPTDSWQNEDVGSLAFSLKSCKSSAALFSFIHFIIYKNKK